MNRASRALNVVYVVVWFLGLSLYTSGQASAAVGAGKAESGVVSGVALVGSRIKNI